MYQHHKYSIQRMLLLDIKLYPGTCHADFSQENCSFFHTGRQYSKMGISKQLSSMPPCLRLLEKLFSCTHAHVPFGSHNNKTILRLIYQSSYLLLQFNDLVDFVISELPLCCNKLLPFSSRLVEEPRVDFTKGKKSNDSLNAWIQISMCSN